jgi:hypothetical protein
MLQSHLVVLLSPARTVWMVAVRRWRPPPSLHAGGLIDPDPTQVPTQRRSMEDGTSQSSSNLRVALGCVP